MSKSSKADTAVCGYCGAEGARYVFWENRPLCELHNTWLRIPPTNTKRDREYRESAVSEQSPQTP